MLIVTRIKKELQQYRANYLVKYSSYNNRMNNQCLASIANCALHCIDSSTNRIAINNAQYRAYKIPHTNTWMASLLATRRIKPNDEILWPYGATYMYPNELSAV